MGASAPQTGPSSSTEPKEVSALRASVPCAACRERGKTWEGGDPNCAFDGGAAFSDNWNCATVDLIRDLFPRWEPREDERLRSQYCDDQWWATVNVDGIDLPDGHALTLWVSWYKNRGRTEAMWLLSEYDPPRLPTEADVLAIAAAFPALPEKEPLSEEMMKVMGAALAAIPVTTFTWPRDSDTRPEDGDAKQGSARE